MYHVALNRVLQHIMKRGDSFMNRKRRFRRLWYFKRRNLRYNRILLCITSIILVFILMWMYICDKLFPAGLSVYEERLYEVIQSTVENKLSGENVSINGINSIVDIEKDFEGRITSAKADNIKLNKLSFGVEKELSDILINSAGGQYTAVKAPVIPVLNSRIIIGGARVSDVETTFVSRFIREGSDITRLRIYLNVEVSYEYLLGTQRKTFEFPVLDAFLGN